MTRKPGTTASSWMAGQSFAGRLTERQCDALDARRDAQKERRLNPIDDDYTDPTDASAERRYMAELASAATSNESKEQG